jgi:hypothetical protein
VLPLWPVRKFVNLGIWMKCRQQEQASRISSTTTQYPRHISSTFIACIRHIFHHNLQLRSNFVILRRCSPNKIAQDGCASCSRVSTAVSIEEPLCFVVPANIFITRLTEEVLYESTDARTEVLAALRELGPPDLVHLIKKAPRNPAKEVCRTTDPELHCC